MGHLNKIVSSVYIYCGGKMIMVYSAREASMNPIVLLIEATGEDGI